MTAPKPRSLRCAIYTRKSTEEGLDQAFNSLHAQREACEAYVKSQAGEGWALVRTIYDDGGYSGGSMERPALQALLSDVDQSKVDVVVVYKVDRLTRSLTDFAKIVERFDKRGVSFVSVTQSFNTTNSMGRLTLNVLLSFAQFEREVASERIRDKIGASRRKGMWMGGSVPVGYDVKDRKLVPNEEEMRQVRHIFERYTQLKSINELRLELKAQGIKSVLKTSVKGNTRGGYHFSRGALTHLLRNRVYLGEVKFKGAIYAGEHLGILDRALFDRAQAILDENCRLKRDRPKTRLLFPLMGLVFDDQGNPMSPSHTQKSSGRRLRYYVSRALIDKDRSEPGSLPRVPAQPVEDIIAAAVARARGVSLAQPNSSEPDIRPHLSLRRVEIHGNAIILRFDPATLEPREGVTEPTLGILELLQRRIGTFAAIAETDDELVLTIPVRAKFHGGERKIFAPGLSEQVSFAKPDATLIRAVVRAHAWLKLLCDGTVDSLEGLVRHVGHDRIFVRRVLRLAFLNPQLTADILDGRQPENLLVTDLFETDLPHCWSAQSKLSLL